ncbi:sterol desaturase family protein [Marinomonas sp. 2405UD68-3]|uniref:sterol desaturase family protein n=1 Tax=Marinomonas sp. 2405UD68-3 TaxID=3391835 RepID=UPI0039C9DFE1
MDAFFEWFSLTLSDAFADLINPKKRVTLLYLFTAIVFASTWYALKYGKQGFKHSLSWLAPAIWWHPSSRRDYSMWLLNKLIISLIGPSLLSQAVIATWIYWQALNWQAFSWIDGTAIITLPNGWVVALFTACFFIIDDFSRFFLHWLMHKSPTLWAFHQVHHSAETMTPFTVFRTHPLEGILFSLRSAVAQGIVIGVFAVCFPKQMSLYTVFGVVVSTYLFNLFGANLRHSTLPISYGKYLERFIVSPAQHQLHHSLNPSHFDCNFGVVLAVWDRLFGTLQFGNDHQKIHFGVSGKMKSPKLFELYYVPLQLAWVIFKKRLLNLRKRLEQIQ